MAQSEAENWVFLGDSLTEGVGSSRISYVSELVNQLRRNGLGKVDELRIRQIDPESFSRFVKFNLAGFYNPDFGCEGKHVCVWNLASEGRTIETDMNWLSLIKVLQPNRIFVFRGALESIIRPAALFNGLWPFWLPKPWREYAALDPRCYFSTTWWRRSKQIAIDRIKQKVRLRLLKEHPGKPMMDVEEFEKFFKVLIGELSQMCNYIYLLGLLPIDEEKFPGSSGQFNLINLRLEHLAGQYNAEFVDWGPSFKRQNVDDSLFYLDGFHPNDNGAKVLGGILYNCIVGEI